MKELTRLIKGRGDAAELREWWEERAAIAEYMGGMGRDEAERSALEQLKKRLALT